MLGVWERAFSGTFGGPVPVERLHLHARSDAALALAPMRDHSPRCPPVEDACIDNHLRKDPKHERAMRDQVRRRPRDPREGALPFLIHAFYPTSPARRHLSSASRERSPELTARAVDRARAPLYRSRIGRSPLRAQREHYARPSHHVLASSTPMEAHDPRAPRARNEERRSSQGRVPHEARQGPQKKLVPLAKTLVERLERGIPEARPRDHAPRTLARLNENPGLIAIPAPFAAQPQ